MFTRVITFIRGHQIAVGATALLATSWTTKHLFDDLAHRTDAAHVHPDQSVVEISVKPQVERRVAIVVDNSDGKKRHVVVGKNTYSKAVHAQIENIEDLRHKLRIQSAEAVKTELDPVFSGMQSRTDRFANWYFGYTTTFKLLREASTSAARHALGSRPLNDAVAQDLERYLERKYERIVLQPEISDPQLQHAYKVAVRRVHNEFVSGVSRMQQQLLSDLSESTTHMQSPESAKIVLTLDWASQLYKIKALPAQYEKMPEITVALSAGGALVGKAAGAAGGKVAANAFLSKLAAPFVTKVIGPGAGALAGSFAGPFGALAGAIVGVGIDYGVSKGVELVQRDAFIDDLKVVIRTTQADYENKLQGELLRVVDVWIDDTVQLLLTQS